MPYRQRLADTRGPNPFREGDLALQIRLGEFIGDFASTQMHH
jgi:hypothetical protein